jgi:hypothetical protein
VKDSPDGFAGGDCSECSPGPLDDGTENLCGCPCDGFDIDFEELCEGAVCNEFPSTSPDNLCFPGSCLYSVVINDEPPCDLGGACGCEEQDGGPDDGNPNNDVVVCE